MFKGKKIIGILIVLTILLMFLVQTFLNSRTYAATVRKREGSLDNLNDSYPTFKTLINELQTKHPNWTFTILYTGLDWNTVITNETTALHSRSLVQNSGAEWVCSVCGTTPKDNGSWYCASQKAVKYFMDARNWLTDEYIFAFETLSYDSNRQTLEGVKEILKRNIFR